MAIIITTLSIFIITGVAWVLSKALPFKACPICAGVSGTWLWMLIGMFTNQLPVIDYQFPAAILMGGSIVGIAYSLEKHVPRGRSLLLWKALFIPAGFIAVYEIVALRPVSSVAAVAVLIILALVFLRFGGKRKEVSDDERIKELEKKMEECC